MIIATTTYFGQRYAKSFVIQYGPQWSFWGGSLSLVL